MKKTIRDSVFVEAPVNVQEDHIEVASVRVDTHGIRGLTIEEQVARLRERAEMAESQIENARFAGDLSQKRVRELIEQVNSFKARMRKRARSKR